MDDVDNVANDPIELIYLLQWKDVHGNNVQVYVCQTENDDDLTQNAKDNVIGALRDNKMEDEKGEAIKSSSCGQRHTFNNGLASRCRKLHQNIV